MTAWRALILLCLGVNPALAQGQKVFSFNWGNTSRFGLKPEMGDFRYKYEYNLFDPETSYIEYMAQGRENGLTGYARVLQIDADGLVFVETSDGRFVYLEDSEILTARMSSGCNWSFKKKNRR